MRFLAALWVVLAHFHAWGFAPASLGAWLPESGRDAVVLFFVLSGFVIAYTCERKDGRTYLVDRAARIYSVALPVVLATTGIALADAHAGTVGYARFYQSGQIVGYLGLYFAFLGNAWFLQEPPFGIIPYWSLNFEVWYYVLFGLLVYLRGVWRAVLFLAAFAIVGFKLWLLWPVWLAGVWLYRYRDRWPMPRGVARAVMALTVIVYAAMEVTGADHWLWAVSSAPFGGLAASPLGDARFFASDYAVAVLAVAHLYAFRYAEVGLPRWSAPAIRWLAGCTFTLYLAHGPILTLFGIHFGKTGDSVGHALLLLVGLLAAVVAISYGTERQVALWRRGFGWLVRLAERCLSPLRRRVASTDLIRLHR